MLAHFLWCNLPDCDCSAGVVHVQSGMRAFVTDRTVAQEHSIGERFIMHNLKRSRSPSALVYGVRKRTIRPYL